MKCVLILYAPRMTDDAATDHASSLSAEREALTIDVVKEEIAVGKELVETGRVQIAKTVLTEDVNVQLEHLERGVDVERRPIDETYDEMPESTVHLDDGAILYRVIREVPVVVMRYAVTEEIIVRPRQTTNAETVAVPVRREQVDVRRVPSEAPPKV